MVLNLEFLFCSIYFLCRTDTIETWNFDFFRKLCTTISKIDVPSQFFGFLETCILSMKSNNFWVHSLISVPEIWADMPLVFFMSDGHVGRTFCDSKINLSGPLICWVIIILYDVQELRAKFQISKLCGYFTILVLKAIVRPTYKLVFIKIESIVAQFDCNSKNPGKYLLENSISTLSPF